MIRQSAFAIAVATGAMMFASQADAMVFEKFWEGTAAGTEARLGTGNLPKAFGSISVTTGEGTSPNESAAPMTIAHQLNGGLSSGVGNEIGIGVCGSADTGSTLCGKTPLGTDITQSFGTSWNGQNDELENAGDNEFVRLMAAAGVMQGQFLLGSFDGAEAGFVSYTGTGGAATATFQRGSGILAGNATIAQAGAGVYGNNVFLLSLLDFDTTVAQTVTFRAGCGPKATGCGSDNDYLVAAAAAVPIPAALPLFGTALAGLGFFGWRKRKASTP